MAILSGAHMIIYSKDAEADRAFFRDVFGLRSVDAGGGWLIFALPPSEIAMHPADDGGAKHQIMLMTDNVDQAVKDLAAKGVRCAPVSEERWGRVTEFTLPGGSALALYQSKHPRP